MLPRRRIDLVTPDQVLIGGPVRDIAVENALRGQQADRIGQSEQVQVARRELRGVEEDARQLQQVDQLDAAAAVHPRLHDAGIPERDATRAVQQEAEKRVQET